MCEVPPKRQRPPRFEEIRKRYVRSYADWTPEEDARLVQAVETGQSLPVLARALGRKVSAVKSRLKKLGSSVPK